jgi:hypothetical protein
VTKQLKINKSLGAVPLTNRTDAAWAHEPTIGGGTLVVTCRFIRRNRLIPKKNVSPETVRVRANYLLLLAQILLPEGRANGCLLSSPCPPPRACSLFTLFSAGQYAMVS